MKSSALSLRARAFPWLLASALIAAAQAAPPPLPQPELIGLPVSQQSALRELRGEFDRNIGGLSGESRAVAYLQMGALYLRSGLPTVGNIALDHAVAAQPLDPRFVYLRGMAALRQRDAANAIRDLSETIRLDPNYLPAHYHLAEVQMAEGNLPGARATLAPLLAQRKDLVPALAMMGEIALREERHVAAIGHFEAALKLEPAATALYARLAAAHEGRGDAAAAARANASAGDVVPRIEDPLVLALDGPGARSPDDVPAGSASAAPVASSSRAPTTARAQLDQRVRATPSDLGARLALIEVMALEGDLAGARVQLQTAQRQAPQDARVRVAEAIVAEAANDDTAALAALAQAVAADPKALPAQLRYADALMRTRQFDRAYRHYLLAAGSAGAVEVLASAVAAASLANQCADVLPVLRRQVQARANDGRLAQIEVRAVASCPVATSAQKAQVLSIAETLYRQQADGELAETLAMALAANGRGADAVGYEAEAIFDANKRRDTASLAGRRAWLQQFERRQAVTRPWPDGNMLYAPPALRAAPTAAARATMPQP